MRTLGVLFVVVFATICAGTGFMLAQSRTSSVVGTVTDTSGAVVPGAEVTVTNVNTGETSTVVTGDQGNYSVVSLLYGAYTVKAGMAGFNTAEVSNLTLEINKSAKVDLVLTPGAPDQTVEVRGATPLLSTQSAAVADLVSPQMIVDLPLNGRNWLQLATLGTGAVAPRTTTGPGFGAGSAIAVNGNGADFNSFSLDGVDNIAPVFNGQAINPTIDAIQEFKIETNSTSAEYGRAAAQITVATKSGTNSFHGTLYEFLRNDKLDARNFFDRTGKIPPLRQNTFGGNIGGPIVKDKAFFFFSYDGLKIRRASTRLGRIPSEAWIQGDFSDVAKQLTDGFGNPLPGNIMPASMIHPTAKALLAFFPEPNLTGDPAGNNYIRAVNAAENNNQWTIRYDHNLGENDRIFGRLSRNKGDGVSMGLFPIGIGGGYRWNSAVNTGINYTHVFSPKTMNAFRLGYSFFDVPRLPEGFEGDFGAAVKPPQGTDEDKMPFMGFGLSGYSGIAWGDRWIYQPDHLYQIGDNFTVITDRHTFKMGADVRWWQSNLAEGFGYSMSFDGRFSGNPIADMLLGYASSGFSFDGTLESRCRRKDYAFYFQDDFRVTRTLTMNWGFRYDYMTPIYDGNDNLENFVFDPANRTAEKVIIGEPGFLTGNRYRTFPDRNNFAPRIGFAWNPASLRRTVFRVGYGLYYVPPEGQYDLILGPKNSPLYNFTADNSNPRGLGYYNPWPVDNVAIGLPSGGAADWYGRTPYVQQWNLNIQHELKGNILAQVAYVGNVGTKLGQIIPYNQPPTGPGPIQERRPYPAFGSIELNSNFGTSAYHGLQIKGEKRYTDGLALLASYTWSKAIDSVSFLGFRAFNPYDLRQDRGLADHDMRHRFVSGWLYDLPIGQGRRWLSKSHAVVDAILGGWAVGGITTFQTGVPFTPGSLGDPGNRGGGARADVIGDWEISNPSITKWFNTSAFAAPAQYTVGNAGRGIMTGPGINSWDINLSKSFRIHEEKRLQVRGEFFNAFNHPSFNNPGATFGTPSFGVISSAGAGRVIQMGAKFYF